jgi:spermidine synthase
MAALVTLLFFLSGMVALAYEVVWVRALGLVVGNSLWAAVAVVAAFMGGMAGGSALVARYAGRLRRHLRIYAAAEGLAAVAALSTSPALALLERLAAHVGAAPLAGWGIGLAARFGLAWLFLVLPTTAMGATLPLLVARVGQDRTLAWRVGRLYAANTFGAVAGVVVAGFVALPELGEKGTLSAFAIVGALVAAVAWGLERRVAPAAAPATRTPTARSGWLLFPAFFGFTALACELVWTRILLLHLGSRVYAFAVILAVYLVGIAGGAAVVRGVSTLPRRWLAASQVLAGAFLGLQIPLFARFGDLLGWLGAHARLRGFIDLELGLAAAVAILILPATMAFGASFPLAVATFPSEASAAERTGAVAAANTAGAIVGSIVGPLVLVPLMGSQGVIFLLGAGSALAGLALASARAMRGAAAVVASGLLVAVVLVPPGTALRGAAVVGEGSVEEIDESASATVVVRQVTDARGRWRSLELNGVNVAGTSPELYAIQRLQGHLPLLLNRRPERVLHIGFGSGGTAWAVAQHRVRDIVVAEISPDVLEVSDRVFGDVNHGVLRDPRVHVLLNDGRNVLLATRERFDAILSDSIHPVYAGNSTLYTREYFELCREHLRPGGVVSMWLPLYSLTEESYLAILRAFWEVFPSTCVWYDPLVLNEFTVVTGSLEDGPVRVRWQALGEPSLRVTLAEAGVRGPESLAAMLLLGPQEVATLVSEVSPHVDDFPEVEYRSGRLLDRDGSWLANFRMLWTLRTRNDPFAAYPGDWSAAAASRDAVLRTQLRELSARVRAR